MSASKGQNLSTFKDFTMLVTMDGKTERPDLFEQYVKTAINEGDEDISIKIAGREFFVEILGVQT